MFGGVKGSSFGVSGIIDFMGENIPVIAQEYCIYLCTWVYLDGFGLCPILHGEQQSSVKGDLSILCLFCLGGAFFWVTGGLHTVGQGWHWDYLYTVLVILDRALSPMSSGRPTGMAGEGLREGLWHWEWLECLPGEQLDLHLLLDQSHVDLGLLFLQGNLPVCLGDLALLSLKG